MATRKNSSTVTPAPEEAQSAGEHIGICERAQELHAVCAAIERTFALWSEGSIQPADDEVGQLISLNGIATRMARELAKLADEEGTS